MSKKRKMCTENKADIVQLYLISKRSISQLSREYNISTSTIKRWIRRYQLNGIAGLEEKKDRSKYDKTIKENAVKDYLEGRASQTKIIEIYDISSTSVLDKWIKLYTSGKTLQTTGRGLSRMKQGRQTTVEERMEIVNFTIAHEKDYQAAVERYSISYQQIYSWVRKFEKEGKQGLLDRRGKGLEKKSNLTSEEKLQLKIKQQEERIKSLEMEVGLLKKLEKINRRHQR